jgi:hypothetical protein
MISKLQEIYFDICDLLNVAEVNHIKLKTFQEFKTMQEFLQEQKRKLEELETEILEELK